MPKRSHDWLAAWVRQVSLRAGWVAALALISAAGLLWFAATTLSINTSTTDMLSEELPFRQNNVAVDLAFPQRDDTLVVVIEAPDSLAAETAALDLAARLREQPEIFEDVFDLEGEPFFRRNGLLFLSQSDLEAQADRLAEAEPLLAALQEDPSLRGLQDLLAQAIDEDETAGVDLASLLTRLAEVAEALPQQPGTRLSWQGLLEDKAETPEDRRRFLVVKPRTDFASLTPLEAAVAAVKAAAAEVGITQDAGYRLRMTGEPLMLQDELYSVRRGIGFVGLLSAVLVAAVLFIGLRTWRLVLPIFLTLIFGLCLTAGYAALAVGQLNVISVAFAVLFIGLSVDFGIHFALRFREVMGHEVEEGHPSAPRKALSITAALIGRPLLLCGFSSAVAFFAFMPTAYRGLSELGLIAGGGMFIALFANLTVLPALLCLWPIEARPLKPGPVAAIGAWIHDQADRRAPWLVGLGAVLAVASLLAFPQARFDDDPLDLRDQESPSVATLLDLLDDSRFQPYGTEVLAADLAEAQMLSARLAVLPEVEAVVSLADFVPADQEDKLAVVDEMVLFLTPLFLPGAAPPPPDQAERRQALADLQATMARAPQQLARAAERLGAALRALEAADPAAPETLERAWLDGFAPQIARLETALEASEVTLEDLPAAIVERYQAADGRVLMEVQPRDDLRDPVARAAFVDAVQAVAPIISGPPVFIVAARQAVLLAFTQASLLALAAISLLLWIVLRSLRDAVLVLTPLCLAAAMTVAAGVILDLPFNFANVIVLPLLLGLGVDSGIHTVIRARELRQARKAMRTAGEGAKPVLQVNSTPRAILLSSLTTVGSFGALGLSGHPGTASMGTLLTLAIAITLFCVLLLLPALVALTERMHKT